MASKTVITYVCDSCGKEEKQMNPGDEVNILAYRVTPVAKRPVSTAKAVEVHYHPECTPGGIRVLLDNGAKKTA